MSLIDRYKETLQGQGVQQNITAYKKRRNKTKIYLLIIVLAIGIPAYFFIFKRYTYCSSNIGVVSGPTNVISTIGISCGVETVMYSVIAALSIALLVFITLKALKYKKIG